MVAQLRQKWLNAPMMLAFRSTASARAGSLGSEKRGSEKQGREKQDGDDGNAKRHYSVKLAATEQFIRAEVRNDLSMLVNAVALESTVDLEDYPHVRASILNYGVPDIVSRTIDDHDVERVGHELKTALTMFEPRLVADTIATERDPNARAEALALRFVVRGDLVCHPVNVPVEFLADVEFESQKIVIKRL